MAQARIPEGVLCGSGNDKVEIYLVILSEKSNLTVKEFVEFKNIQTQHVLDRNPLWLRLSACCCILLLNRLSKPTTRKAIKPGGLVESVYLLNIRPNGMRNRELKNVDLVCDYLFELLIRKYDWDANNIFLMLALNIMEGNSYAHIGSARPKKPDIVDAHVFSSPCVVKLFNKVFDRNGLEKISVSENGETIGIELKHEKTNFKEKYFQDLKDAPQKRKILMSTYSAIQWTPHIQNLATKYDITVLYKSDFIFLIRSSISDNVSLLKLVDAVMLRTSPSLYASESNTEEKSDESDESEDEDEDVIHNGECVIRLTPEHRRSESILEFFVANGEYHTEQHIQGYGIHIIQEAPNDLQFEKDKASQSVSIESLLRDPKTKSILKAPVKDESGKLHMEASDFFRIMSTIISNSNRIQHSNKRKRNN